MLPLNDRNYLGDGFDQPPFAGERRYYAICCPPRVGSWLLCSMLHATGRMGVPGEYFNLQFGMPQFAERLGLVRDGKLDLDAYITALQARRTTPNGVFGFKIQYWMLGLLLKYDHLSRCFPRMRYVYLDRADVLLQGISYEIARQTGSWSSFHEEREPVYDEKLLKTAIRFIQAEKAGWEGFFAQRGISPLRIDYAKLVSDPGAICGEVCTLMGIAPDGPFELETTGFRRQRTALYEQWLERLRAG